MSNDIANMNDKQLRKEVQLLRDELAIFKRKYEDIIYNLDDDNFSSKLIREKEGMKTSIEVNAEGIKSKVSKEDLDNSLINYSTISQTAAQIKSTVTKEFMTDKLGDSYVTYSEFTQTATGINATVSSNYNTLSQSISSVTQTAEGISSKVTDLETFKTSVFTQNADGFILDGEKTTFTGVVYLTDEDKKKAFSIFFNKDGNFESVRIWGCNDYRNIPVIIGGTGGVYVDSYSTEHKVATQGWVNNGITPRFA